MCILGFSFTENMFYCCCLRIVIIVTSDPYLLFFKGWPLENVIHFLVFHMSVNLHHILHFMHDKLWSVSSPFFYDQCFFLCIGR